MRRSPPVRCCMAENRGGSFFLHILAWKSPNSPFYPRRDVGERKRAGERVIIQLAGKGFEPLDATNTDPDARRSDCFSCCVGSFLLAGPRGLLSAPHFSCIPDCLRLFRAGAAFKGLLAGRAKPHWSMHWGRASPQRSVQCAAAKSRAGREVGCGGR